MNPTKRSPLTAVFPKLLFVLTLLGALLPIQAVRSTPKQESGTLFRVGDNANWSLQELDETDWSPIEEYPTEESIAPAKVHWIRIHFQATPTSSESTLYTSLGGKYDIFLNGEKLGSSRKAVTHEAFEVHNTHGTFNNHFPVPAEIIKSPNAVLAIRLRDGDPFYNSTFSIKRARMVHRSPARFKAGDNVQWASPKLDDSEWLPIQNERLEDIALEDLPNNYWIRRGIYLHGGRVPETPRILEANFNGTFDLYWDGVYIGSNGTRGDSREEEIPGRTKTAFHVPDDLFTPGPHTLAFGVSINHPRAKLWSYQKRITPWIIIPNINNRDRWIIRSKRVDGFSFATMTVIGGFFIFSFFIYKRSIEYLAFGLICIGMAIETALVQQFFDQTHYPQEARNSQIVLLIAFVIGLLYPIFFLARANFRQRTQTVILAPIAILYALSYFFVAEEQHNLFIIFLVVSISGLVTGIITLFKSRTPQNWLVLLGTLCLIGSYFKSSSLSNFFVYWIGIGFTACTLFLLISLVFQMRLEQKEKSTALREKNALDVQKSRLELELLKSSIQPHFLMNTLTSIMEWVEEEPNQSIQFIDALAKEFRLLYEVSSQTLIPLSKEIELCQSILRIMHYRKRTAYKLDTHNCNLVGLVPPLIFHTLLENSITHNEYPIGSSIHFELSCHKESKLQTYTFKAPYNPKSRVNETSSGKGTGSKYIQARLEESYPNKWALKETKSEKHWITSITIPRETHRQIQEV